MKPFWQKLARFETVALALAVAFPLFSPLENGLGLSVGIASELTKIFVFCLLALGLNVIVGYTGLLHLGIAAFFGIGVYVTGILTVESYPFQIGFYPALAISTFVAALIGILLGAPTLRLRGDYLALVTLGFGEVVRYTLRNLEEITAGTRGLNPIPPPAPPKFIESVLAKLGLNPDWSSDASYYFTALVILTLVLLMLRNLEGSRLGRAWVAVREDELAANCMGLNTARIKLSAFALGCGLAGTAGSLYATVLKSTADPNAYDFNRSIIVLCCIILGGLASLRGTLMGVLLLVGFDNVLSPMIDTALQNTNINPEGHIWLTFSGWRLMLFGLALILMMRFRPEGLLPSTRLQEELHGRDVRPAQPAKA